MTVDVYQWCVNMMWCDDVIWWCGGVHVQGRRSTPEEEAWLQSPECPPWAKSQQTWVLRTWVCGCAWVMEMQLVQQTSCVPCLCPVFVLSVSCTVTVTAACWAGRACGLWLSLQYPTTSDLWRISTAAYTIGTVTERGSCISNSDEVVSCFIYLYICLAPGGNVAYDIG